MPESLNPSKPTTLGANRAERVTADFGPQTAGRIMMREVFTLNVRLTVQEAIESLRERADIDSSLPYYVYVVDTGLRLAGVLSMRDLALARPVATLAGIMRKQIISVRADADQEDVARIMQQSRYLALPVLDDAGSLLGIVTVDAVMDVMAEEATEDVQRMFGAGPEERLTGTWQFSVRRRLPWLLVNLLLAFIASSVIRLFEGTIGAWAVLAVYMPIIAGMGGNASAQAMSVAIRGIADEGERLPSLRAVMKRELRVGAASGALIGFMAASIALVLHSDHGVLLPILVFTSLLINHIVAPVWGASVPFVMSRLGFDPAQSATIFTTALTDMLGFLTFLGLAALALHLMAS